MMDVQTKYQAELKHSDQEHHQPTAGAMIGHVTANLWMHQLKIEQARLFARGTASLYLEGHGKAWQAQELNYFQQLHQALRSEGDLIPTTSEQLKKNIACFLKTERKSTLRVRISYLN